MTKLVPIVSAESQSHFCMNADGTPYVLESDADGHFVLTGFLRMGQNVSLLGLAHHADLLDHGVIDQTDSLSADVRLSALAIGTPDGVVHAVLEIPSDLEGQPPYFVATTQGGQGWKLVLNFDSKELKFEDMVLHVQLVGIIDLQTSVCEVHAVNPQIPKSNWSIIGYKLDAERINSNRRLIAA